MPKTLSNDFKRNELLQVTIDAIAARYGKLPSEILIQDLDEFTINRMVCLTAVEYEASVRKGKPKTLSSGMDPKKEVVLKLEKIFGGIPKRGKYRRHSNPRNR